MFDSLFHSLDDIYCNLFQLLPYAQKLLDQLLLSNDSEINTLVGAPGKITHSDAGLSNLLHSLGNCCIMDVLIISLCSLVFLF